MTIDKFKRQDGYECPTCEKLLNTSLGLKQHHTKVHGESLRQTSTCDWCGETFHPRPSQVGTFCSKECQMKRRKEKGVPASRRQVTLVCDGCGEEFSVPRSAAENGKRYCSNDCYYSDSDAEYLDCEWCGDEFYVHGERVSSARFCTQDCYGEWISANESGSNSVHWKGDDAADKRPPYGPGFNKRKRELVRERDGRECTRCGMTGEAHVETYGMKLHVHHEVKARNSTNPAVHNAPRNLRTLCASCHQKIEPA